MRGLINRVRTSVGALNFLYRISGFLNLFGRRFDREKNRASRAAAALPQGYLNGQNLPPLAELPYGAYTVGWCGCEAIAVYNALLTLGRPQPFDEVAAELEQRGLLLNGLGGTHLAAARRYLERFGLDTDLLGARRAADYDAAFSGVKTALLAYWTGAKLKNTDGSWNMLHTVAIAHAPDGGVTVYNAYGGSERPAYAVSVAAFLAERDYLPVMLCTAAEIPVDK